MFKKLNIIGLVAIMALVVPNAFGSVVGTPASVGAPITAEVARAQMFSIRTNNDNLIATVNSNGGAYKDGGNKTGKTIANVVGAGIGATILGVGTAQAIKASNRAKFDSAQSEWMNEVGNHIRCFIGPDEVGSYGDIISTELE